jgi:AraC family ethanolamine operon transcriptional activator
MALPIATAFRQRRFDDGDEAAASISNVDVVFSPLGAAERPWVVAEAQIPGLCIISGQNGAPIPASGRTHAGFHSFFVPRSRPESWTANGQPMGAGSIGYLGPSAEYVVSQRHTTEWLLLQVHSSALGPFIERHGHGPLGNSRVSVLECDVASVRALEQRILITLGLGAANGELMQSPSADRLRLSLVSAVAGALPHEGSGRSRQATVAGRIHAYLQSRGAEPVTSEELRTALSISERTLRRHFHDVYGASPARFLRNRRLHLARRALRSPVNATVNVTEVCTGLGFYDLGRFASDYRSMFGERPSETLRRAVAAGA